MADNNNVENTLKKMAIVLEKVVKKVDELDKRVTKLEMKVLGQEAKEEKLNQNKPSVSQPTAQAQPQASSGMGGFGTGFLSSLLGTFAGMSLFNLLFNNSVSASELAHEAGVSEDELQEIEEKLDHLSDEVSEIDQKLDQIDESIDEINSPMDSDFISMDDDVFDDDFGISDDFDVV